MKPAALAYAALAFAALTFAACQDQDKSYDAMYGPENVLQAPLTSEANRQTNKTNRELFEKAVADSAFYAKHHAMQGGADTAPATHDAPAEAGQEPAGSASEHMEAK